MKKLLYLFIIVSILFANSPSAYAEAFSIDAPSYILIDPKTGEVLLDHNSNEKMYPASTTKIMTAILALEMGKPEQLMKANSKNIDPGDGGMNIGIMPDEEITMWDLLHGLLIQSANETANIIADNLSPTRQDFIDLMNKKALELGATGTHFVTTNGMHDPDHYTTVSDMAKIARYAMSIPQFRDIVGLEYYDMSKTNKHEKWNRLYTTNKLLRGLQEYKSDVYTKVTGIKTGYTTPAGHNFVASAEDVNGMELLSVVFGVRSIETRSNVYTLSRKLLEYGFKNFAVQKVEDANEIMKTMLVSESVDNASISLVTESSLSAVLPLDKSSWNIETSVKYFKDTLEAPIKKGDILGYIEYKRSGVFLGKVNIVANKSIDKSIKAKSVATAKSVAGSMVIKVIAISSLIAFLLVLVLRFVLKGLSRILKARRQTN